MFGGCDFTGMVQAALKHTIPDLKKYSTARGSFETIFWVLFQIYEMQYAQIPRRLLDLEAPDGSSKGVSSVAVGPEL